MKKFTDLIYLSIFCLLMANCRSGLVTMSNSCYKNIDAGKASNQAGNYNDALDKFNLVLSKCDAYDAKEKGYAGKAEALNGLTQYNDALTAANEGLKVNANSIDNLFQKANAELGLKMNTDAKADLARIVDLTQKNQNVKDRATIYAKMAELDVKQNMYSDAMNNVQAAITADSSNTDFYILQGDIYAAQKDYANAMSSYNQAIIVGGNSGKVWQAKVEAETKMFQKKYATGGNAADLAGKMSAADKQALCSDITTAKSNGVKVQNIDLLQLSICK